MSAFNISLQQGDICLSETDAIVNAANSSLLGGGGVDGAIHAAAGPALLAMCEGIPLLDGIRCPVGQARITGSGNLKCRYIIHTVGPIYSSDSESAGLLQAAYQNSLLLALANNCRSVALPAVSCGVYAYPAAKAAALTLATCSRPEFRDLKLEFYLFDETMMLIWSRALAELKAVLV
ncbi:macro domain-containing protein [Agaribacterium sp. ZY112]|uniref:macro domain-containing protein n=1 Tax=Agaribacterium sp. ZY112 TaxID=3233574 RepID=UPI0035266ADC